MKAKVVFDTYENGKKGKDVYDLWFADDQFREATGIFGGAIGGIIVAALFGFEEMDNGPFAMALAAFVGKQVGEKGGEKTALALYDALHAQYEGFSEEEKVYWREKGYIPFDQNALASSLNNTNENSNGTNTSGTNTNSSSGSTGSNTSSGNYGHSSDGSFNNSSYSAYLGGNGFLPVGGSVRPESNSFWNSALSWVAVRYIDPLVLDLDGDGIETLAVNATTHILFDGDKDGIKVGMGWVKGDDGFLVLDRNGNGTIDNGGELFGDQTIVNGGIWATNGFNALSDEDTNNDRIFDAGDTNFTNVRVWQDTNQDGISQTDELHTLTELGIASINLTSTTSNTTTNGNVQTLAGTYTKSDGTTGKVGNFNFAQNAFYREFTDHLTLTDTALSLPDMQGSGMVRVNNLNFGNVRRVA